MEDRNWEDIPLKEQLEILVKNAEVSARSNAELKEKLSDLKQQIEWLKKHHITRRDGCVRCAREARAGFMRSQGIS